MGDELEQVEWQWTIGHYHDGDGYDARGDWEDEDIEDPRYPPVGTQGLDKTYDELLWELFGIADTDK